MASGDFRLTQDGAVATLTLDRGERRNALTTATLVRLKALAEGLREAADIRAVIIRAEAPDFSVGMDLGGMNAGGGSAPAPTVQLRRSAEPGGRLMRALREIQQSVICAVQGVAEAVAAFFAKRPPRFTGN